MTEPNATNSAANTAAAATAAPDTQPEKLAITTSRGFTDWLARSGGSIAFTTYQAGKLFLIGLRADGRLSVFERSFARCMGIAVSEDGRSLALASEYQLHRFDNVLPPGQADANGFDAVYAPHAAWVTGDCDAHDVGFDGAMRPFFVNTRFSCISAVDDGHSFRPIWQPRFVSRLAAEDRCHLNGMAVADGRPAFASAVSQSDVADGWRDRRGEGGVVIDCASGEVAAGGLSMPHSPRLYKGELWLLNSGAGQLGRVDPASGAFQDFAFCPGYARGLCFAGNAAIVGLSHARDNRTFSGLALDDALKARDVDARCGLAIFDLDSGDMIHWLRIEGVVRELFDVAFLPGVRRPSAIGFMTDEVKRVISIAE